MRLADQRPADARAMKIRLDRQRRQRHGWKFLAVLLHEQSRKQHMADHLAVFHSHQFDHGVAIFNKRVDQSGLRVLAECVLLHEADRLAIPWRRRPD